MPICLQNRMGIASSLFFSVLNQIVSEIFFRGGPIGNGSGSAPNGRQAILITSDDLISLMQVHDVYSDIPFKWHKVMKQIKSIVFVKLYHISTNAGTVLMVTYI